MTTSSGLADWAIWINVPCDFGKALAALVEELRQEAIAERLEEFELAAVRLDQLHPAPDRIQAQFL